ncbi:trypsin-like serine protease [Methylomicrobium lacus]|uniref:S1 family peptidase n=1 Tax=Methylomicrobium lacus TaxID=136992 RepID=UPI0035A86EED
MHKHLALSIYLWLGSASAFAGAPQPAIVNGVATQDEPATGALLLSVRPGASPPSYVGICSGTLIGCSSFLTAAHCVCENLEALSNNGSQTCDKRKAADLRVFLQNSGIHQVSAVKVHPSFKFGKASDVAVLTLAAPVQGIPPMAVNSTATPPLGTSGIIAGFGVSSATTEDFGIKRTGKIVTADCADAGVPQPANICWEYQGGAEGEDSNICFGDSGGPLFIDLGIKRVIAGISSGVFDNCQVNSFSFDTNVYQNHNYIKSKIARVLDETGRCRIDIRKRLKTYANSVYNAKKQCLDAALAGKTPLGSCLNEKAAKKIDKAVKALAAEKIAKRCPAEVIENSALGGRCASAANPDELRQCIVDAGNDAVTRMLDAQYADAEADFPIADRVLAKCQSTISSAAKSYLFKSLNALNQCEAKTDRALTDVSARPLSSTLDILDKYAASLQKKILKACPEGAVEGLIAGGDRFGAGCNDPALDAALAAACEKTEHDQVAEALGELAPARISAFNAENCGFVSQVGDADTAIVQQTRATGEAVPDVNDVVLHKFDVPEGVRFLRVTLNGQETVLSKLFSTVDNSLDLYLRHQETPSVAPRVADAFSINTGGFEALQVKNPAPGEWRALVHDAGEVKNKPYQLTVTMIKQRTD